MKKKDLMVIIIVIFISGVFSLVISNYLFASPKNRQEEVEVVEPISADFKVPEKNDKYFNSEAIDPTLIIKIGDNNNQQPFNTQ